MDTVYGDGDYRTFWGLRILAVDGLKILLPDTEEIRREFGTIEYSHGPEGNVQGERPYALASVLYDVLNRVGVDAVLGKAELTQRERDFVIRCSTASFAPARRMLTGEGPSEGGEEARSPQTC